MNPFVNPRKRSFLLPGDCKNLADLLSPRQRATKNPIRRFINLLLMQMEQDGATELVVGVAPNPAEGTPIDYKVDGHWYGLSPFPSEIRARVVSELGRMAGLKEDQFPQDGVVAAPLADKSVLWRIRIATPTAKCVLTKTDV